MNDTIDIADLKERCIACTEEHQTILMKYFERTGHFICKTCLSSVTSGRSIALVQCGYKWKKDNES